LRWHQSHSFQAGIGPRVEIAGDFLDVIMLGRNHGGRAENTNKVTPWFTASSGAEHKKAVAVFVECIENPIVDHIKTLTKKTIADARSMSSSETKLLKESAEAKMRGAFITYFGVNETLIAEDGYKEYLDAVKARSEAVTEKNPGHGTKPTSVCKLILDAAIGQDDFVSYLKACLQDSGVGESAVLMFGPIKKPSRILCKLLLKMLLEDPECIFEFIPYATGAKDVIRAMVLAKTPGTAKKVGTTINDSQTKKLATVRKHKDRYTKPTPGGWRDENLNIAVAGGTDHIAEIQITLRKMSVAREELGGHHAFEEIREIAAVLSLCEPKISLEEPKEGNVAEILEQVAQIRLEKDQFEDKNMELESLNKSFASTIETMKAEFDKRLAVKLVVDQSLAENTEIAELKQQLAAAQKRMRNNRNLLPCRRTETNHKHQTSAIQSKLINVCGVRIRQ
jgi:hypothetical protein